MTLSEQSLFERICNADVPRDPTMGLDRARVMRSIARNLERILVSRVGHAPAQMDYGMPDPVEIAGGYPDNVDNLRRALKSCIERFEPRLVDVQVLRIEIEGNDRDLTLMVRAELRGEPGQKVSLSTLMASNGKLQVQV